MPTIQLTDAAYRRLQTFAVPFEDTVEDVIVRLMDQAAPTETPESILKRQLAPFLNRKVGAALTSHVGSVPHGTKLEATYKGRRHYAEIDDGRLIWNGDAYESLSQAAVAVIQSTGSTRTTENGWRFWEYLEPVSQTWCPVSEMI